MDKLTQQQVATADVVLRTTTTTTYTNCFAPLQQFVTCLYQIDDHISHIGTSEIKQCSHHERLAMKLPRLQDPTFRCSYQRLCVLIGPNGKLAYDSIDLLCQGRASCRKISPCRTSQTLLLSTLTCPFQG